VPALKLGGPSAAAVCQRRPTRRGLLNSAAAALAAAALPACVSAPRALVAGQDYVELDPPVPVATAAGQIEVLEFFWLGCPHCADMHPHLLAWARRAGPDVRLQLRPAVLGEKWLSGARLHHALAQLGELDRLVGATFEAVQLDGMDLDDEEALAAWAHRQGLDRSRFLAALRSPDVRARAADAAKDTERYRLRGVPSLVIDGRYLTSNGYAGSSPETLQVVDGLIAMVRQQRRTPA
jgi:protein dithiol oxidoreductase (disulfide-forming)